jgi:hypothetical protein
VQQLNLLILQCFEIIHSKENISILAPKGFIPLNRLLERILLSLQEIENTVEIATNIYKEIFPNIDLLNKKRNIDDKDHPKPSTDKDPKPDRR